MLTYESLQEYYNKYDRIIAAAMHATHIMSQGEVEEVAKNILPFIDHRYIGDPLQKYSTRIQSLMQMQQEFEVTGKYAAISYKDIPFVDRELYNLSLLLSFILTNHRFEILTQLRTFIKRPINGPPIVLSIGAGTGYEITLINTLQPDYTIEAFEIEKEALEYANDLLDFYKCPSECLKYEPFPLETAALGEEYKEKYGKIIMCEVLEHLEKPEQALQNLKNALHKDGEMFLTMAINIAQEDHIYLYSSVENAKTQVLDAGLTIIEDFATPVTIFPFKDRDNVKRGNYICVVARTR